MEENTNVDWLVNGKVDEQRLMMQVHWDRRMTYYNGTFYGVDGPVSDDTVRQDIYRHLRRHFGHGLKEKVESILWALRLELKEDDIHNNVMQIHVANGTFHLQDGFTDFKHICQNRLAVNYNADAPTPQTWLRFLDDLLEEEDILTLQEYLGYCLIPTNSAQKMLVILGDGGEGKSRIGVLMARLLGAGMLTCSLDKIEHDRFARANLEGKLLMVDDDLNLDALKTTHHIKSIITAAAPMDLERKGQQSYQASLNCRFLCFGNGNLQALHDRSRGFYRRQMILTCKPRRPDRVDDPFLDSLLARELEGIFLWCLEGLYRLIGNNMQFTVSQKAMENLKRAEVEGNNLIEFLNSDGYFVFDPMFSTPTRTLYAAYCCWCNDNATKPFSMKAFSQYLIKKRSELSIRPTNNVYIGDGRRSRGFEGIRVTV